MFGSRRVLTPILLACFLLSTPALAAGPLTSGVTTAGALSGPSFLESWTFDATNGDRLIITAVPTSGAVNTAMQLRAPGGAVIANTSGDRLDLQVTSTGTFTLDVTDVGLNDAGTYNVLLMNLTAGPLTHPGDLDGDAIGSAEVRAGAIDAIADVDAFTFSGTAGQRILFGVIEGTSAPFNVQLTLYPPGGGTAEASTGGGNRIDAQLAQTGTYTVVVEDVGDDHPGSYTVSLLNVTAGPHTTVSDPDGGTLPSSTNATGTIDGVIDWDAFTFDLTSGDRVAVVALTTGGSLNTATYLYPPGGGSALIVTSADRWDTQVTLTGTYTLVVEDQSFGETGTYELRMLDLTSGPLTNGGDADGGPIGSGDVVAGTLSSTDLDAFTFTGTAGDRVLFGTLEGTPSPFNVTLEVFPPGGGSAVFNTAGNNRVDLQLGASGTYTVLVEDVGNDHSGSYTVSYLNVTSGPHTTGPDPDGSPLPSSTSTTGTINGVIDWDAFTFSATSGDRVAVVALATSGSLNTTSYLYPPNGASSVITSAADRWDTQLTQTGTYTLVIEDQSFGDTGTYRVSMLNLTSGPFTSGSDPDGGAIASGEVRAGTLGEQTDLDGFTLSGAAGERVLFGVIEGAASPFNVTMTMYPPGGGSPVASTAGGNKIDTQLAATGTYTVVVEDVGNDHTGGYTVSHLNVTAGPHTTLADPDGAPLPSATRATGTINGVIDWDAFTFSGVSGERIAVGAIKTSGALNTTTYLYPPNGGNAIVSSVGDRWDAQLTQTGTWVLVVEDQSFGESGDYALTMVNLTSGPYTAAGDPDGGPIGSDEIRAGSIGAEPDLDVFTFSGTAGDRVVIAGPATSAGPFNTVMALFPPGGGPLVFGTAGGDRVDYQLAATGTYALLMEDAGNDQTGDYAIEFVNVTSGPVTGTDPDGGWITSGASRNGTIDPVPDLDVYWFDAQPGDTAKVSCVTTLGALNTTTVLYPPGGGNPVVNTTSDTWTYPIQLPGRHALMVQHQDFTLTGAYALNLTGPLTSVDVPGETPSMPRVLALSLARPNPSHGDARFSLELPRAAAVTLAIYDVRGALIRRLEDRTFEAGVHSLVWDGRDSFGHHVPSGVYFARVVADGTSLMRRLVQLE